jgi:hypothetical protein
MSALDLLGSMREKMTLDETRILKEHIDTRVDIVFRDGEHATIRLLSVSDSERDIIYEVISSSREWRDGVAYLATFNQIEAVRTAERRGG